MKKLFFLTMLVFSAVCGAQVCENKGPNIILMTLDGVRNQEFFKGTGFLLENKLPRAERGEVFSHFWDNLADQGVVLGGNSRYTIGSKVSVSLPSYQAIFLGKPTECKKNGCESVQEETVLERIKRELKLEKKEVAAFASWNRIVAAIAKDPSIISHGIYPEIFDDQTNDPEMKKIQADGMSDLPEWSGSRKDKYTFALAHHYLKKHCPRVLYISLVDSDENGHAGNYPGYVRALRSYDDYLKTLVTTLEGMGEYGKNTTLFVTTDHSRGRGPFWVGHGTFPFTERNIFLYVKGPQVTKTGRQNARANHLYLRPTFEKIMGLTPSNNKILPYLSL
jgi:hypothetical protein